MSIVIRGQGPSPFEPYKANKGALAQPREFDMGAIADAASISLDLTSKEPALDQKLAMMVTGAAIASQKPVEVRVEDRKSLPYFLWEAEHIYPSVKITTPGLSAAAPPAPPAHQPKEKFEYFIACQMTGLSDEQREDNNKRLHTIDETLGGSNYCQPFTIKNDGNGKPAYNTPADALKLSLDNLQDSKKCVFFFYDDVNRSRPPGMWVEAGHALMEGKDCLFLVPDMKILPSALQVSANQLPSNLTIAQYDSHDQVPQLLEQLTKGPSSLQVTTSP